MLEPRRIARVARHLRLPCGSKPPSRPQAARVTGAIQQAAKATGTSFQYLLATAKVESNLNPNAVAKTSLGRRVVSVHRADLARHDERGGAVASAMAATPTRFPARDSGRYVVADPASESRDPQAASGPDRQCDDGRRADQEQCRRLVAEARPLSRPTASSIWRIFSAPMARRN